LVYLRFQHTKPEFAVGLNDTENQTPPTTPREATDKAIQEQLHADAQDALQRALAAHRALKHARADFDRAQSTLRQAELAYADATAKLLPFRQQVAA
jgi:hypothetical protein